VIFGVLTSTVLTLLIVPLLLAEREQIKTDLRKLDENRACVLI
jgi:Cu/Ag efflux pump CusA